MTNSFGSGDKLLCAMCDSKGKNEWVQSCGFCSEKVICDQCNDIEKCYYLLQIVQRLALHKWKNREEFL